MRHWGVQAGSKVAVAGLGGLGHMAVQLAKAMGAEVTVLTTSEEKREDARQLGAGVVIVSDDKEVIAKRRKCSTSAPNTASCPKWK